MKEIAIAGRQCRQSGDSRIKWIGEDRARITCRF